MTIKTPKQIARETVERIASIHATALSGENAATIAAAAIKADRAQRTQIHPDWRDDQENVRDAAHVDVAWTAYDAQGRSFFASDMSLTATQAVGMFQGIGEAETARDLNLDPELEGPEPTSAEERDYGKYLDQQFWGDRD